jgi:arginine:ornithine antiporter / lysine permease
LKLAITGESYNNLKSRIIDAVIATVATIYSVWVIISGTSDLKTFILGMVLLSSGIFFYGPLYKKHIKNVQEKELLSA